MFSRRRTLALVGATLLACLAFPVTRADLVDKEDDCEAWTNDEQCDENPSFMLSSCPKSCFRYFQETDIPDEQLASSFYELNAEDIDGNRIDFIQMLGKVIVITNVASDDGLADEHYEGMMKLHKDLEKTGRVEILAFPCNQFGEAEPGTDAEIKAFAEKKKVPFRMMKKIDVNGDDAHPLYKFLRMKAGPKRIKWNFSAYFVVDPSGKVRSFKNAEPMELKKEILGMLSGRDMGMGMAF